MKPHPESQIKIWNSIRNENCTACSLHETTKTVCLTGDGPVPCDAMIVGEAPGVREDDVRIPFSGKSGVFLRQQLKTMGVDPRQVYITNVVACRPPGNRTPKRKEANTCADLYLKSQIEKVKPKAILFLGNVALTWALGRKSAVTKMEGSTFTMDGITCVPSRHPSSVIRLEDVDPREFSYAANKFRENLHRFKRVINPVKDNFQYERNWSVIRNLKIGEPLYTDIETNGLNPFKECARIHCIGACHIPSRVCSKGPLVADDFEIIQDMLKYHPIMAQGGTFEGTWYYHHYGILPLLYYDTRLGFFVQDENQSYTLKERAVRMLGVEPWDEEQDWEHPDFEKMLPYCARDNQYGLRLFREHDKPFLKRNPKVARLLRYILLPAEEVFTKVICRGVHINMDEGKKRLKKCQQEKKKINDQLNEIAGREVNPGSPKQMSKLLYDQLRLECPVSTAKGARSTAEAALIRLRGKHPATDLLWSWRGWDKNESTYLLPWTARGPILHFNYGFTNTDTGRLNSTSIKDRRGQKKVRVPCIFCPEGRPKATCNWCERTGWIDCGLGATAHQCPRDPFIRSLISPRGYHLVFDGETKKWKPSGHPRPDDWCIVAADLSQIELRLVAHASGDRTMCRIFNEDGDIHYETARELVPDGEISKETRKKAKSCNFGFVYGMKAKKFITYALEKFDLKLTEKDGRDYRKKFFNKYSDLLPWHRRVEAYVTANGFIDSVFGRRRHLPSALPPGISDCPECLREGIQPNCFLCGGEGTISEGEAEEWIRWEAIRQAINSPIQSAGSDLNLFITALMQSRAYHEKYLISAPKEIKIKKWNIQSWDFEIDDTKAFMVASAHDSQIYECRKDYAKELCSGIKYTVDSLSLLTRRYFGFNFRVPIRMDCNIYDVWEGQELKL